MTLVKNETLLYGQFKLVISSNEKINCEEDLLEALSCLPRRLADFLKFVLLTENYNLVSDKWKLSISLSFRLIFAMTFQVRKFKLNLVKPESTLNIEKFFLLNSNHFENQFVLLKLSQFSMPHWMKLG